MNLNIDIAITDAEEFADLWDVLDEMIQGGDVPQHYRTRLTAIRRAICSYILLISLAERILDTI